jgi:hypothetical protein
MISEGGTAGSLVAGAVVQARRLAAGRESTEGAEAARTGIVAWHMTSEQSQALLGRRLLPGLHWAARLGIDLLGVASIPLLNHLEAQGAHRASALVRLAARAVLAVSVIALAASIVAAAIVGQWLFVGCAAGTAALSLAVEKGWLPARLERPVTRAMLGLVFAQCVLTGAYFSLALMVLAVAWSLRAERNAARAANGTVPNLQGIEQPAIRPAIETFLRGAVNALDPDSAQLPAPPASFPEVVAYQPAIGLNYHGLSFQVGPVNTSAWPRFVWPDWIAQDRSSNWEGQMRDALRRHNPDQADELRALSVDQLWQRMQQRLHAGFESIRTHRSNGGAIEDWRPLEACVQEILNQVSTATTPDHRQRVRQTLCGLVGRLQACGAGVDTALQEAVRDELQGGSSVASNVLRFAANFRQGIVEEALRDTTWLTLQHGQTGVHALEEAALALPELNLPILPVALRDANCGLTPLVGTMLRRRLAGSSLYRPSSLIEAVGLQLSASALVISAWLEQRFPADSALRQELEGHLAWLPVADETEYPAAARQRFFNHLATAMLLDVGMLRPAGV